ncbi:SNF2 family N-terminal domain-containing protein [Obelidium mucronatum]|nr:SNF2 family N-terminal domain-containing protein [Obelidium mucronatum]
MGAGGPSNAPLPSALLPKKALSRSISFQVTDDDVFEQFEQKVVEPEPKVDLGYLVLGTFSAQLNHTFGFHTMRGQENIFKKISVKEQTTYRRRNQFEYWYCLIVDGYSNTRDVSNLFPFVACAEAMKSKCEFWMAAAYPPGGKVDIKIEVRWPGDEHSLKAVANKEDRLICFYWANGGSPYTFLDNSFVWPCLEEGVLDSTLATFKVPATFDIVPCPGPEAPFALKLYDYQLRTLAWMQGIEDGETCLFYGSNLVPLGEDGDDLFMDLTTFEFGTLDTVHFRERNVRSGIIADKPGVGKTITTLALCHSRPFEDPNYLYTMKDGRFRSRATVLLVPNNIAEQWEQEIRKCLGDSVSVIQIKGKGEYSNTTLDAVLKCDLVIVSYQFLTNGAYKGSKTHGRNLANFGKKYDFENSAEDCQEFAESRVGDFAFTWVHFHRVVCDEFHEITDKAAGIRDQVREMSGDFLWGLTGTPRFEEFGVVAKFADFLNLNATSSWVAPEVEAFRFIQHRVRRNEPDVTFPAPIYELKKVVQTPMERAFYQSCLTNLSIVELLKLCNHYQIGNAAAALIGNEAMTIEKVTELVQKNRGAQIRDLKRQVENAENGIVDCKKQKVEETEKAYESGKEDKLPAKLRTLDARIEKLKEDIIELKNQIAPIQAQFNYFENFVNSYLSPTGNKVECNICLDDDVRSDIGIVPCGHAFCWPCTEEVVKSQGKCPNCRAAISAGEVMKVLPPALPVEEIEVAPEDGDGDRLDPNMFGSKIREMVNYLHQEMTASEDARFIVFIQFADLADLVSGALNTYGIATARLKKGWQDREKALRLFRAGLGSSSIPVVASAAEVEPQEPLPTVSTNSNTDESSTPLNFPELAANDKGKRKAEFLPDDLPKKAAKIRKVAAKKVDKPVRVLMLSARDSVSGLNLTEASHCIVLHPFHSDIDEYAIASEKQGIARVLRNGQTKVVKIVRFYVENTVESRIHETRVQIHGEDQQN